MEFKTIGFIGLGLIGGSLAQTIRRIFPETQLIGYDTRRESLAAALRDGTLNRVQDSMDEGFAVCDLIFLCAPVSVNIACLKRLSEIVRPDCLISDVSSVKTAIHEAVAAAGIGRQFIGGHPMAGSERSGYDSASSRLLENAYFILTPAGEEQPGMLEAYVEFVRSLGSLPLVLEYHRHDRAVAAVSHLPHLIAYTLVNVVRKSDDPDGLMRTLAAGGFRDLTRIASSSPEMWRQVCLENREALEQLLDLYLRELTQVQEALREERSDWLLEEFTSACRYRSEMPQTQVRSGIEPLPEIYTDIADEPGAISIVTAILAANRLNLKNLKIINNRENQNGVLCMEFANADDAAAAAGVLRGYHYVVYER